MLQIKIHGATPKGGKSICTTCKKASVIKGQNCQEIILCGLFGDGSRGRVPFKVAECGDYHPVNMPWLHEMEGMAWEVKARKRGAVGFEPDKTEMEVIITPPKGSNETPTSS